MGRGMSHKVVSLVYSRRVGSAYRKAILAYMADRASDNGEGVFCSKGTIADETEIARSTVFKLIRDLVEEGVLIEAGHRPCKNGSTVVYDLNLDAIRAYPEVKPDHYSSLTHTSPPAGPVRGPDQSGSRTGPAAGPYQSGSRTPTGPGAGPKPSLEPSLNLADAASARATLGFIELVCEAAGGRFGEPSPSGSVLGLGQDEADAVRRWQSDLGLTQDEILMEVRRQAARKRGGPVKSLTYFTAGMQDRAGQKQADAALMPTIQRPTNGDRNGDTEPSAGRGASGSTHPDRGKRPGGIVGAAMRHYSGREA